MDFPEAVTKGLRRSTDMARASWSTPGTILTLALRQQRLEEKLGDFQPSLADNVDGVEYPRLLRATWLPNNGPSSFGGERPHLSHS